MEDPVGTERDAASGIHFPPPFIYVACFLLGLLLERVAPAVSLPRAPALLIGAVLLVFGFGLLYWSLGLFLRARTSPLPMRPTTALVRNGPYRWTRNPMYTALLLVYAGVALWFDVFWALVLIPAVVVLVQRLVIRKEERYLETRFGQDYLRYKQEVRRWV
ncbi:MAG TPA: isoprenylcysteine carboxylmethyltransferase family protein [Rhodothermales bacterium]|nr:isoprenylcysteine carboxylmethyltransferase family protein [Rhodothermales bacterium]